MTRRNVQILSFTIMAVVGLIAAGIILVGRNTDSNANNKSVEQQPAASAPNNEQLNDDTEGDIAVEPNVNTQEFRLTASNVSCSSTSINGVETRNCSGNIRVIPRAQADMEPGLYKINEQTKLLHDGQAQDLNMLQQLAQNQYAIVRLKLAEGSNDTLAEISY